LSFWTCIQTQRDGGARNPVTQFPISDFRFPISLFNIQSSLPRPPKVSEGRFLVSCFLFLVKFIIEPERASGLLRHSGCPALVYSFQFSVFSSTFVNARNFVVQPSKFLVPCSLFLVSCFLFVFGIRPARKGVWSPSTLITPSNCTIQSTPFYSLKCPSHPFRPHSLFILHSP
jgi:hypothetical protein